MVEVESVEFQNKVPKKTRGMKLSDVLNTINQCAGQTDNIAESFARRRTIIIVPKYEKVIRFLIFFISA